MTANTLYRFSAAALALATLGLSLGNAQYLLSGGGPLGSGRLLFEIVLSILLSLGLLGLYLRQADRAGWVGFAGAVIFFVAQVFGACAVAQSMGLSEGILTEQEAAQAASLPMIALVSSIGLYATVAGEILFGWATFRAGVFSKWAGLLLALTGLITLINQLIEFDISYIFIVVSLAAWVWLSVSFWMMTAPASQQMPQPA